MKNFKNYLIGALLAACLFMGVKNCSVQKKLETANNELSLQKLENQRLDSIKNKLGQTVYTQEAVIFTQAEYLKNYTDSMFKLFRKQEKRIKDVLAYYQSLTIGEIKEVPVPYVDTLSLKKWEDSVIQRCSDVIAYYDANTISVPRTAKDSTEHYNVDITVRQDSLKINSIQLPDTQYIRFVTIKGGFLKKDTYGKRHFFMKKRIEVQVLHTNPFITVKGQTSAVYKPPKGKGLLGKGVLITLGILLGKSL